MPYPGVPEDKVPKMESCVARVMKQGKDKESAIKICRTAITGRIESPVSLVAASADEIQAMVEDMPDILQIQGSLPTNAILKFEGACLARAEVNKNRDGLMPSAIGQLADSIRLMPLTQEHKIEPRGIVTRGYTSEDGLECLIDGLIWAGHFPEFAEEVKDGTRKLSLDAEAAFAICGECGTVFTNPAEYCEHMNPKTAVRWLHDLTAVAAGGVLNPAGTGTLFPGANGIVIVSGWNEPTTRIVAETKEGGDMKCPECGHEWAETSKAEELQSKLDEALSNLAEVKAKLEGTESDLTQAQEKATADLEAERRVMDRYRELAAKAGTEVADGAVDSLREASDTVFQTLLALAERREPEAAQPPEEPETASAGQDPPPEPPGDSWNVEVK